MARIRVAQIPVHPGLPYLYPGDRSGTPARLPIYRLLVGLAVLPRESTDSSPFDDPGIIRLIAILDTGASLSIFPFSAWSRFTDQIRWLDLPQGTGSRRVSILGGTFGYRLGRVKVGAFDAERRWLPPATLTAFFLDDVTGAPREVVFGLRNRLLDGRQLRHEPPAGADPDEVPGRWWLEDAAAVVNR